LDIGKMSIAEMEMKLEQLWDAAAKLSGNTIECDRISDEILAIRRYCIENNIELSPHIAMRF